MAANIYNHSTAQTSSPPRFPQDPPDEISLFLQQIVLRSSSSSSSFVARRQSFSNQGPGVFPGPGQISAPPALMNSSSGFGLAAANAACSSVGRLDSEADECDYESEEAVEAAAAKPAPCRSSSKRSRAAEVHNQSEKRRRSRINEKMKALQNLIPNSNKTDKASMLDEAIEYLKQLQLQVQTLTLRHGLSLYPICLSGVQHSHQMKMDRDFIFDSTHNPTESISMDHQSISNQLLMLDDKSDNTKQTPVMDFSCTTASKSSFKVESGSSATLDHSGTYQCPRSSKKVRIGQQVNADFPVSTSTGAKTHAFGLKESTLEACLVGDGGDLLQNFVNHPIFSSHQNM